MKSEQMLVMCELSDPKHFYQEAEGSGYNAEGNAMIWIFLSFAAKVDLTLHANRGCREGAAEVFQSPVF